MLITDFNISNVHFVKLPKNREIVFVMSGQIFQYENDFLINCIYKSNDSKKTDYYMTLLPLKAISAFPLGMIFKNQKITRHNKVLNTLNISLNLEKGRYQVLKTKDIPLLAKFLTKKIPEKINGYNVHSQILHQNFFEFTDLISSKKVIFPHYEIARWYYMRSSSLTRQVLSSNLEGLYKDAEYLDKDKNIAEIILKYGSNNNDAADIFRFAKDEFANIMFHSLSLDLSANKYKNKIKKYTSMSITANFPVYGEIDFKVKGFSLDKNTIFIYQIIEENSDYPFEKLNAYREVNSNSNKKKPTAQIKKKKSRLQRKAINIKPASDYETTQLKRDNTFDLNEFRRGLERKKISHKPILIVKDDKDLDLEKRLEESGLNTYISFNDAAMDGDGETAKVELINDAKLLDKAINRKSAIISYFINMIFKIEDVFILKGEEKIVSINISDEILMPQKDPNDKNNRKKWLKSTLVDNLTPRKYIFAHITIDEINYCVIEVEKDSKLQGLSTLLLHETNNEIISNTHIHSIMINFIENNGKWLKNFDVSKFSIAYLSHIKIFNDAHILGWAKNLIRDLPKYEDKGMT